ncbi:HlyD family secretion protein [Pectinatus sottacetonis]|uniref:HlyD family secretion protein n=1 Tax=Pectinatus sottacetonis TaxID=1002795 RepID=UPI0018C7A678|nr:HlyD family secretion protein [Pectinatus sottacetonis]
MKVTSKMKKAAVIFLVVFLGAGIYYFIQRDKISTDDAAIDGQTVDISPKISGYIKNLYVKDNQIVKAGEVIMQIDPKDYQLQVENAKAALAAANAALAAAQNQSAATAITAPANVSEADQKVNAAQAAWEKALADKNRMGMLIQSGACSQQEYDQAVAAEKSTRASLAQMKASLVSANSAPDIIESSQNKVKQLQAQVAQAQAELDQAENNLQHTKIVAPMAGRITKKSVNKGAYVQAGTKICSLVSFNLWVTANFKENELHGIKPGDKVKIKVDAFPDMELTGKVDSFQAGTGSYFSLFPAENATGNYVKIVQRVPVRIVFDKLLPKQADVLGPGMSVVPTVYLNGAR